MNQVVTAEQQLAQVIVDTTRLESVHGTPPWIEIEKVQGITWLGSLFGAKEKKFTASNGRRYEVHDRLAGLIVEDAVTLGWKIPDSPKSTKDVVVTQNGDITIENYFVRRQEETGRLAVAGWALQPITKQVNRRAHHIYYAEFDWEKIASAVTGTAVE